MRLFDTARCRGLQLAPAVLLLAFSVAEGAQPAGPTLDRKLIDQYCLSCHNERMKTGGLTLESIEIDRVGAHADTWEKVVRKLRGEQMPPAGRPRPDKAAVTGFVTALEAAL